MSTRLCALFLMLAFAASAPAQQAVPSDNDLRTAYCVPVIKDWLAILSPTISELEANANSPSQDVQQNARKALNLMRDEQTKAQDVLNRLQLYLLPKMQTLAPVPLAGAIHRGEADAAELNRCSAKCAGTAASPDGSNSCMTSCADPTRIARVKACHNPTWLPF